MQIRLDPSQLSDPFTTQVSTIWTSLLQGSAVLQFYAFVCFEIRSLPTSRRSFFGQRDPASIQPQT